MRLYYFDACYRDGGWTRHWYATPQGAEEARAKFLAKYWPDGDYEGQEIGERGDVTEVDTVAVEPTTTGVLRVLRQYGDPNGD